MPRCFGVGGVDFLDLFERALFVEAVRDGHGLAVIGQRNIFVAQILRRQRHFLDRVLAVARRGVHLQVAANVIQLDQIGQAMLGGRVDFARVFAQFRRNVVEAQLGVNLLLGRASHGPLALERRQRVFVQRVAHLVGAAAQRDVVFLRSGEIEQRGAKAFLFENPHVDLQSVLQNEADLVLAVRQRLVDSREFENVLRDRFDGFRRVLSGRERDQQVEVADRFLAAPQRSRRRDRLDRLSEGRGCARRAAPLLPPPRRCGTVPRIS